MITSQQQEKILASFKAMYSLENEIEARKDENKETRSFINDHIKEIAKEVEMKVSSVRRGYKDWIASIKKAEEFDEAHTLTTFVMEAMRKSAEGD
jgi:tRNA uridine 5-carbamoylmethylation protein Kti12